MSVGPALLLTSLSTHRSLDSLSPIHRSLEASAVVHPPPPPHCRSLRAADKTGREDAKAKNEERRRGSPVRFFNSWIKGKKTRHSRETGTIVRQSGRHETRGSGGQSQSQVDLMISRHQTPAAAAPRPPSSPNERRRLTLRVPRLLSVTGTSLSCRLLSLQLPLLM